MGTPKKPLIRPLREVAEQNGIENVNQFCVKTGLQWTQGRAYWNGDVTMYPADTLRKIARGLGLKVRDLFVEDE